MKTLLMLLGITLAVPADRKETSVREVRLSVAGFSSQPDTVAAGASVLAGMQVDEVWVSFKNLALRDSATCKEDGAAQVKGPVTAELVGGRAVGLPERVKLTAARYCGVALTLQKWRGKGDGVSPDLRGYSILIRARRDDGTRIVLRSRAAERIWLAAGSETGFAVADEGARWILAADLARWLGGLDFTSADVSQQGGTAVIKIDDRTNKDLLATFEQGLAAGLGLYHDADGDGALSDSERTGDARLASGG